MMSDMGAVSNKEKLKKYFIPILEQDLELSHLLNCLGFAVLLSRIGN